MKKRISATVEPKVAEAWKDYCEKNCINASKMLAKLISDHLKENGERDG